MANCVDPEQTAPIEAVYSGSTLFASILNSSVMLGNYLQQTTSADDIFRYIFLGALRDNIFFVCVIFITCFCVLFMRGSGLLCFLHVWRYELLFILAAIRGYLIYNCDC